MRLTRSQIKQIIKESLDETIDDLSIWNKGKVKAALMTLSASDSIIVQDFLNNELDITNEKIEEIEDDPELVKDITDAVDHYMHSDDTASPVQSGDIHLLIDTIRDLLAPYL